MARILSMGEGTNAEGGAPVPVRPLRTVPAFIRPISFLLISILAVFSLAVSLAASSFTAPLHAQDLPRAEPESVGLSSARLDSLGSSLRTYVSDGRLPGGVLLVARRGSVVWLDAFGFRDREARDLMETDDLFRIASQTKAIVSVAAMRLVDDGLLHLDDPVSRWIPDFDTVKVAEVVESAVDAAIGGGGRGAGRGASQGDAPYRVVPVRRPITIRHLLTHTSGLGYGTGVAEDRWVEAGIQGWYFADRDEPVGVTVERMAGLPLDAHPGERWIYGYSIDVLGAVVEQASGLRLDAALRAYVLAPLGMDDTWFYPPLEEADRLAVVYSRREGALERAPDPGGMVGQGMYVNGPRVSFSGGAGLVSTAEDYAKFLRMLLNEGMAEGGRVLAPGTVAAMITDHAPDVYDGAERGFGLGFELILQQGDDPRRPGSFGWGGAYHSTYWIDPAEELAVVYLTQINPASGLDDYELVRRGVYEAILDGADGGGGAEGEDRPRASVRPGALTLSPGSERFR